MTHDQLIEAIKKKQGLITLAGLARETGISITILRGAVNGYKRTDGRPYKIAEKYFSLILKTIK